MVAAHVRTDVGATIVVAPGRPQGPPLRTGVPLCSRPIVTVQPCESLSLVLRKMRVFTPLSGRFVQIRTRNARNLRQFKGRFSFVFKYFLASFPLFSIFRISRLSPLGRTSRHPWPLAGLRRLPATMCRQNAYYCRLVLVPQFVK